MFSAGSRLANVKIEYYGLYKMVDAMYKMILKQLWNERKGNLFIWLEMLVVSIFLWYAADALFVMYRLYSQPWALTSSIRIM